jgi:biopolymer transport protein ExbD
MGEINVVPYIDVMLVLLIIFMITAPLLAEGIKVELPKAGARPIPPEMLKDSKPIVLTIDETGRLYPRYNKLRMNPSIPRRSNRRRRQFCAARQRPRFSCVATTAWPTEKSLAP